MNRKNRIKKPRNGFGSCPSDDCSGGTSSRQSSLTPYQEAGIPAEITRIPSLRRCGYCGAVYEYGGTNVFGWYDNAILGDGWHPRSTR
jgi:hypothetical protein